MSAPTGEASTPAAPAVPAPQPQTAPTPAAAQSAPAQPSADPQQPAVSGGNLTHAHHTVPVAQGTAQGQQNQAPPTGASSGPGASVPRAPAAPTRDTSAIRSLGPAVNSLVKKVCETPPPFLDTRLRGPAIAFSQQGPSSTAQACLALVSASSNRDCYGLACVPSRLRLHRLLCD